MTALTVKGMLAHWQRALLTGMAAVVGVAIVSGTLIVSDASEQGRVELEDVPRVEQVQLRVSEELHNLANPRQHHTDDGT